MNHFNFNNMSGGFLSEYHFNGCFIAGNELNYSFSNTQSI
ncbi:hypothetical protein B4083_2744 [Bacillus cereus]|nr:hypothetical protein B4083_2744 [Bacillus cereus]